MLKNYKTIVMILLMGLSVTSYAKEKEKIVYIGVAAGTSEVDTEIGSTTGTASLDEDDTGYKVFAGVNITKSFGVEAFYANFGEASLTGNTGDTFTSNGTAYTFTVNGASVLAEATSIGFGAVYNYSFTDQAALVGRIGIHNWKADVTATVTGTLITSLNESGSNLYYSVGGRFSFTDNMAAGLDYGVYVLSDSYSDIQFISGSFIYSF